MRVRQIVISVKKETSYLQIKNMKLNICHMFIMDQKIN